MNIKTKTSVVGWFNQRGMEPLDYQPMAIITTIRSEKKKVVLAAAPNSGKTTMSICIIDLLKEINPDMKVLILTHNQVILRKNFSESIEDLGRPFDYQVIEDCNDPITKDIVIGIPAGLKNCKDLPKFDLIIVDEAHEYYSEKMVKSIIRKVSPKKEILLTGTPSSFIGKKEFDIVYVTGMDVYESGNSAEVYTEICTSTYFIEKTQYGKNDEVISSYNFGNNETITTIEDVVSKIYNRLTSKMRKPKNYAYSPLVDWVFLNKNMGRTFIACRNQPQAKKVAKYFESKGIKTMISTSDTDNDNELLNSWKEDQSYRVLIVVRKGVLGFSDSSIVNLVDMTMSKNINRMFQLYNRVTRKLGDTKKLYIKVVPANLSDYHMVYVTGMLCMLHEEWYTKFNGKNFLKILDVLNRQREFLNSNKSKLFNERGLI
jgi:superfamily II DNA or RNA helicase